MLSVVPDGTRRRRRKAGVVASEAGSRRRAAAPSTHGSSGHLPFLGTTTIVKRRRDEMERESNPMQALCRSGCGFYGNPATDGLCSLCFKEALKKKQQPPVATPSAASASPAQSYTSSLIDTATAQPTVPCIGAGPAAASAASSPSSTAATAASSVAGATQPDATKDAPSPANGPTDETAPTNDLSAAAVDDGSDGKDSDKDAKKKKNRCVTCRKKVGLTGFQCRCGGLFCAVHRYSDKHECSFDYRELGAQEIRRNNPVVVGEKIQKI